MVKTRKVTRGVKEVLWWPSMRRRNRPVRGEENLNCGLVPQRKEKEEGQEHALGGSARKGTRIARWGSSWRSNFTVALLRVGLSSSEKNIGSLRSGSLNGLGRIHRWLGIELGLS